MREKMNPPFMCSYFSYYSFPSSTHSFLSFFSSSFSFSSLSFLFLFFFFFFPFSLLLFLLSLFFSFFSSSFKEVLVAQLELFTTTKKALANFLSFSLVITFKIVASLCCPNFSLLSFFLSLSLSLSYFSFSFHSLSTYL